MVNSREVIRCTCTTWGEKSFSISALNIVPAAERVGDDSLDFAVPGIAEVVCGTGKEEEGNQRSEAGKQIHSNIICKTNQSVAKREIYKYLSLILSNSFR